MAFREPIAVIASFDTKGNVKPLYIRVGEEQVKVLSSYVEEESNRDIFFHCLLQSGERAVEYKIAYRTGQGQWYLYD